jgi:hypothetical protein
MTSIPSNNFNFPAPKRPYAVFISNKSSNSFADEKPNNIPSCRACGNRRMEPLEGEGVYICCGCGRRVPMSMSLFQSQPAATTTGTGTTTTKQEGGGAVTAAGIKVIGSTSTTGGREKKKIAFAQPKHQSAKDWFKRKHDPKNSDRYDADDIALMNRSGVTITHTYEIKRRPDTLPNPTENENRNRNRNTK